MKESREFWFDMGEGIGEGFMGRDEHARFVGFIDFGPFGGFHDSANVRQFIIKDS